MRGDADDNVRVRREEDGTKMKNTPFQSWHVHVSGRELRQAAGDTVRSPVQVCPKPKTLASSFNKKIADPETESKLLEIQTDWRQ